MAPGSIDIYTYQRLMTLIRSLIHGKLTDTVHPWSHLSECAELHDDPDWILCDDSHQLHNVGVVKLAHGHCRESRGGQTSVHKFFCTKRVILCE